MTWLAILTFAKRWWRALVGALVMFPLAFLLGQCSGAKNERVRVDAARAIANVETMKTDGAAQAKAADERVKDTLAITEQQQELTDAVADLPDALPSARRVALACERLRQQGADTATVPACSRSANRAQADAQP